MKFSSQDIRMSPVQHLYWLGDGPLRLTHVLWLWDRLPLFVWIGRSQDTYSNVWGCEMASPFKSGLSNEDYSNMYWLLGSKAEKHLLTSTPWRVFAKHLQDDDVERIEALESIYRL